MEKIGLQAVMETAAFQAGMNTYLAGIGRMETETDRAAGQAAKTTEEMAKKQEAALQKVGLAFSAVGAAGTALLTSLAMTASRSEELGVILDVTATNAVRLAEAEAEAAAESGDLATQQAALARASGLNARAVDAQVEAVKGLGITTQAASKTIALLIRYNLDWQKSTDLARLAQDAATFAAQDSSEALDGLIHGITTLNPRVLRQYGILINLEQEYSKFADAAGRTSTSITDLEKQQIAFNAVLRQAPTIAGAYEASMLTASKQIRSLSRDVTEVAEAFGQHLTPMLNSAVGGLRDLLKWLANLPPEMQATAVQVLAVGSGLASLVGAATLVIPKIIAMKNALMDLALVQQLASAGLLGPVGLVAGLVAAAGVAILYAENLEKAHRQEAAGIATTAESYDEYIRLLDAAGLGSYALSESLYEVANAADEAAGSIDALALQDARQNIAALVDRTVQWAEEQRAAGLAGVELADNVELLTDRLTFYIREMNDAELAVVSNREELLNLAIEYGLAADEALAFADAVEEAARRQRIANDFMRGADSPVEVWQEIAEEEANAAAAGKLYEDSLRENLNWVDILAQQEKARFDQLAALHQAEQEYADASTDAVERAAEQMVDAEERADDQRLDARRQLIDAQDDLEADHADRVEDLQRDLARVAVDLADDILDAEADAAQARIDAAQDMTDALADLERDLAADREAAAQDMARDIAEIERDLADDREDAARDLAQDLEDLERDRAEREEDLARDLARDLADIEDDYERSITEAREDYYADLEELAAEHADRLASIEERYANERRSIEDKYRVGPSEEEAADARREALLEELEYLQSLAGQGAENRDARIGEIIEELDELK
jgi:hypothetical protein